MDIPMQTKSGIGYGGNSVQYSGVSLSLRYLGDIDASSGGDFNSYTQTGFYSFHGGPLNGPGNSVSQKAYGIVNVYSTSIGYLVQDCFWITATYNRSWRISADGGKSWLGWN